MNRFILRSETDCQRLYSFLRNNWKAMADLGRPLQISAAEYKTSRSLEQQGFMWKAILEQVAEQAMVRGRRFDDKVWHQHYKERFLPEINAKGMNKWIDLPDGSRRLGYGTTDLNVAEMSVYMEELMADAATEHGVMFYVQEYA